MVPVYKHENIIKSLIGMSLPRVITLISNGWGGRASDKYITEHSTILRNLLPADVILADRGFLKKLLLLLLKVKSSYQELDIESTRRIAAVRVHGERVIGLLHKKYKILQNPLPLNFLRKKDTEHTPIDKIVTVCAALTNLCDSIPFE